MAKKGKFIVRLCEKYGGQTGIYFESADLGGKKPRAGDCMIAPLPNKPDKHFAFEVVGRYFLRDIQQANVVWLLVKRRELTNAERGIFDAK